MLTNATRISYFSCCFLPVSFGILRISFWARKISVEKFNVFVRELPRYVNVRLIKPDEQSISCDV